MSGLVLESTKGEPDELLRLDGVFIYVGILPKSDLVKDLCDLDERGFVVVDTANMTSLPGLFAAGDVTNDTLKQAITAAAQGATAAYNAFMHSADRVCSLGLRAPRARCRTARADPPRCRRRGIHSSTVTTSHGPARCVRGPRPRKETPPMSDAIAHVTDASFTADVIESPKPYVLDFWAPWCGPCRMMEPVLEEVATENPSLSVGKLNVDENPTTAQQFDILSIPTLLVFAEGQVVKKLVGAMNKKKLVEELAPWLG